jgi:hypothetical protein
MYDLKTWYETNKNVLNHLYKELIYISNNYGIAIINDKYSYTNFIKMMYRQSSKTIINKIMYPEFFYKKYNSNGYEKYRILN